MPNTRTPKEIFAQKLLSALQEFEQTTGVEVHSIDFPSRLSVTEAGEACDKTIITRIDFTLK
jgi:hypothetical protein